MSETNDDWTVWSPEREVAKHVGSRPEAEEKQAEFPMLEMEIYPPGELPDELQDDSDEETVPCEECGDGVENPEFDGMGNPHHPDCLYGDGSVGAEHVDHSPQPIESDGDEPEPVAVQETNPATPDTGDTPLADLGEGLDTDPLDILPSYMVTFVDGKPSLNKRGVSVLAYHFDISVVEKNVVTYPHETNHECAVYEIEVENEDGQRYVGSGEAHVDETPKHQLLRMAETRAYKRAVIFATGTGIVGYQELMGSLQ